MILVSDTKSWDGKTLPPYPSSEPVVFLVRYSLAPKAKLLLDGHNLIHAGFILMGELTMVSENESLQKTFCEGQAFVGVGDSGCCACNRNVNQVELLMAYFGDEDIDMNEIDGLKLSTLSNDNILGGLKTDLMLGTSKSWDKVPLPNYPTEQPMISVVRYHVPGNTTLLPHYHNVINFGMLLFGELEVLSEDGLQQKTVVPWAGVAEMCQTLHHGENRKDTPADLIMFYAGTPTSNLSDS